MDDDEHYPTLDQITPYQRKKIEELRRSVKDELEGFADYDTDFSMLRWLMGYDYDLDTIIPRLKWALNTHRILNPKMPQFETGEDINEYLREINVATDYTPGGVMGFSNSGDVLYVQAIANVDMTTAVKVGSVSTLFRLIVTEMEAVHSLIRDQEKRIRRKVGTRIIIDLAGFSKDLLYAPTLKIYMNLLTLVQALSPDIGRCIYILNAPIFINAAYTMLSSVLSKQTKKKVRFLGNDWKDVLLNELGSESIFPKWGGCKMARNGLDTGSIRLGGVVPKNMWYAKRSFDDETRMKKINVGARTMEEIKVEGRKGYKIRWLWRVSSGDLDFVIMKSGQEVWPKMRLSTEFVPEYGIIHCDSTTYTFIFDNSHGKIFAKDVKYRIELV